MTHAIKALLKERGQTQAWLATETGLSPGMISQIIRGGRGYSRDSLARIAQALGVPVSALLADAENPPPIELENEVDSAESTAPQGAQLVQFLAAVAPLARSPVLYRCARRVPGAYISTGDQLVIDLKTPAQSGELVLAQLVDPQTSVATSIIRIWAAPHLVAPDSTTTTPVLTIADGQAGGLWCNIIGPIVAVIRLQREALEPA